MRKPQTARVVGVDLFCGAGGVTCGMRRAGVDVKLGIDSEVRFSKTYELNNAPAVYWCRDITGVAGLEISNAIALLPSQKFFLSACAPCQPFSRHNKRGVLRGHQDERSDLLDEVGRILCEFSRKPDYIFVENVPGISTKMDSALKRFEQTLFDLKYSTVSGVIDAAKYGVPQHRRRFILVAKLGISYVSPPLETHGPGRQFGYETVEAIRRYPAVGAGEIHSASGLSSPSLPVRLSQKEFRNRTDRRYCRWMVRQDRYNPPAAICTHGSHFTGGIRALSRLVQSW